jgi:hypothetical protein
VDKKDLEAPAALAVQEKTGTDNWHDFIVTEAWALCTAQHAECEV